MLFHSWQYLLFLPATIVCYNLLPARYRPYLLLLASYVFYASWNAAFLSLIVLSTAIDFACGIAMEKYHEKYRRSFLLISIFSNLGLLFSFKYLSYALSLFGLENTSFFPDWILPVGISFYTFQTMSYSVDVYYHRIKAERNPLHFALYVAFFPQLVAGPIERATSLLPQLKNPRNSSKSDLREGSVLFLWGLLKKVVVADRLSILSDRIFQPGFQPDSLEALTGMLFFGLQILFDFSAYTDMARGSARCIGITLMENFNNPYNAKSFREFWQRWHISLSTWFRDYLYIPLGGSKVGRTRVQLNLLITFCVSGLWHGAATTFVVWGLMHGVLLILERMFLQKMNLASWMQACITFLGVHLAWIWFRAETTEHAISYFYSLFRFDFNHVRLLFATADHAIIKEVIIYGFTLLIALSVLYFEKNKSANEGDQKFIHMIKSSWFLMGIIMIILFFGQWGSSSFIYFQF